MKAPSNSTAFQVLLLQAGDDDRRRMLFGESFTRAYEAVPPFLIGETFPSVYLEHPLIGDPFLDVTVLYGALDPGMRVDAPSAGNHGAALDFFANAFRDHKVIGWGFEVDTSKSVLPEAAVHFQPREHTELVRPFCEALGESSRADLYLDLCARMPQGWPLSFFGLFRGRPGSPLRVCGYMGNEEKNACMKDPSHLAEAFDRIGFVAYDDAMLAQVSKLMEAAPLTVDFQFDVFPDGSLGPTFAIDAQFGIEVPAAVLTTFSEGAGARVMKLLESWGIADGRWRQAVEAAFARAIPVELDDGEIRRYAFTLMPQWVKARWIDGALQPAKLYHMIHAGLMDEE